MASAMTVGLFASPAVAAHATATPVVQAPASLLDSASRPPMAKSATLRWNATGRAMPTSKSAKVLTLKVGTDIRVTAVSSAPTWWRVIRKGKTVYVWKGHVSTNPSKELWPKKSYAVRYAKQIFGKQFPCAQYVVNHESWFGGRYSGHPNGPYGIGQANPGTKMAKYGRNWRHDPATQLRWMKDYMRRTYGSACGAKKFKVKNGWY